MAAGHGYPPRAAGRSHGSQQPPPIRRRQYVDPHYRQPLPPPGQIQWDEDAPAPPPVDRAGAGQYGRGYGSADPAAYPDSGAGAAPAVYPDSGAGTAPTAYPAPYPPPASSRPAPAPAAAAAVSVARPAASSSRRSYRDARGRRRFDPIMAFAQLLFTAAAVVGLFMVWQVYVTDWQVASATQNQLQQFKLDAPSYPNRIATDERKTAPPPIAPVPHGQVFATLHVPRWNFMELPIREGTSKDVLDQGAAGHYPSTAMPGQIGNSSVAAHRRSYGSNFRRIDTLQPGDRIVVETDKAWLVYVYRSHQIVLPSDGGVILPVPGKPNATPTERLFTMTTCHPEYGNSHRFIVHWTFDHWVPRSAGIPKELAGGMH